jgi:hypothetical protein
MKTSDMKHDENNSMILANVEKIIENYQLQKDGVFPDLISYIISNKNKQM